jgi:hypothetical protein
VTHDGPGWIFGPSRFYWVGRKCVAAVTECHPWYSVQRRDANGLKSPSNVCVVSYPISDCALSSVDTVR